MFELGALEPDIAVLCTRTLPLCLGGRHVILARVAHLYARFGEVEVGAIVLNGFVENVLLGVVATQYKVVGGKFRMHAQVDHREVARGRFGAKLSSTRFVADPSPDVEFIAEVR